ncbi:hypothetical protein PMJ11TS3_08170 [Paenibacillus melissococcoides]
MARTGGGAQGRNNIRDPSGSQPGQGHDKIAYSGSMRYKIQHQFEWKRRASEREGE